MNHAWFCGDKLPGFIAEKTSFNPLTIENKIPQVSQFMEPCKDLPRMNYSGAVVEMKYPLHLQIFHKEFKAEQE